jgi:hypothetical protein
MKLSITIAIFLFGISSYAQNDSVLYSFFVAGHTYGKPGVNNQGFHPPFKQKFNYIQSRPEIEFGVLTGDIVSPNPISQDWDEIDADIDTLGIPIYFAVGNHDMENRPLFESRYGITYYYFIYQNDLFIVLDPNIDEWNISDEQLQFLQDVVNDNASTTDNIYVFFHQILWKEADNQFNYICWNSIAGRGDTVNFWTEVEPIFRNLPNEVIMFAGDLGASWSTDVSYDHYDNIILISSGMGDENGENFIVVNVDSSKSVHYDLICLSDTNINCLGMLTDHIVVSEILDIEPITIDSDNTFIYPNPASLYITVSQESSSNTLIQLFNIQGVLIIEEKFNGKLNHSINISHIPKGIYLVKIFNDLNQSTIKLIKE